MLGEVTLPPCLLARADTRLALEGAINHRPLLHAPAAIGPAKGDVHGDVIGPEALATLRWPPDHDHAASRKQTLHDVAWLGPEHDLVKGDELEAWLLPLLAAISAR